ncbi:MAG TPA: riboflavin synthase, partial [bacterium]|nr:riboflavin synthase [bacterium]
MFTGIVQCCGRVLKLVNNATGAKLVLEPVPGWELSAGESVAVNGCCLTALPGTPSPCFDLSRET